MNNLMRTRHSLFVEVRAKVGVRRAKAAFLSGCKSHLAMLLQPAAIGAVMEVTKWLKPSMKRITLGDPASVQAVT
jgi:hypothetical protein